MALLLKEDDVRGLLTMDACLAAVEEAFRLRALGQAMVRPRTRMAMPDGTHQLMAGWVGGEINAFGLKSYSGPHKPGVRGGGMVVLLYDGETSALLAILEGNLLGQIRTGAASGVATRYMAREEARTVGIIGTGRQAATQLEAVCKVRDIQQVWAYSRKQERRDAFAEEMAGRLDVSVTAVDTGEACMREADIVVTITSAREPVLEGAWLKEGTHINAAGSNHYLRCELDDEAIRRAALITVDDPATGPDGVGRADGRGSQGRAPVGAGAGDGGRGGGPYPRADGRSGDHAVRVAGHRHVGRGRGDGHLPRGQGAGRRGGDSVVVQYPPTLIVTRQACQYNSNPFYIRYVSKRGVAMTARTGIDPKHRSKEITEGPGSGPRLVRTSARWAWTMRLSEGRLWGWRTWRAT